MINKDNIKEFLQTLGFAQEKIKKEMFSNIYFKHFPNIDTFLKIDLEKQLIIYPEDKGFTINERQTTNFSSNENFVVFECVHRLLEKGYKPEHIELEPKWKLGHDPKSGRADILIKDNNQKPLLLIECKIPGKEFEKAWRDTQFDGAQLFSYAQQIPDTDFLCLYASDFNEDEKTITYISHIISHKDNKKILEDNKELKSFEKAKNVKERYTVWKETYQLEFTTKGIFESIIQPYFIGKDKYTIADLLPIDAKDKEGKYHEFRTKLRKYNISGRERAFDVLVNLFLCKIVDETYNLDNLKFYWKGIAYDSYFELIDRLQELYQKGMDKFLAQEIVYISNEQIDNAFWTVKQKRNATKQQIKDYFRKLKFFTNNDFGFIDVHNEKLFYQNAKVLLEIVQMWQDLRLKTEHHNQFLGDMFEFFLDNGIKQSEGQFFTPMPICKFIIMSLPLENIVKEHADQPRAIDYACGAGHFLTELAAQITPFVNHYKQVDIKEVYKSIYGIEKEYRLSKVAKLSSFMYGHDGIEILHNDALDQHEKIKEGTFDILVANPPFSVEGFLDTLPEEQRDKYKLTETISDISNNRNIQCFFIERAKQLLAPNGTAGIIVPTSVLSNSDSTHVATREIMLQYFDIVSLVELGSGTFGKTGTNTVVLFLRRKSQLPEPANHYKNRVDDWFEGMENDDEIGVYQDLHFIKKYCEHIEIQFEHYCALLEIKITDDLMNYDMFKEYKSEFDTNTDIKNLKTKKFFKDFSAEEQQTELHKRFIQFVREREKDKLYYFTLAFSNPQKVLVAKCPSGNNEQKQFLGYEWSAAKGNEGIKYNGGDNVNKIITPLFDPLNRYNTEKINYLIQQSFLGNQLDLTNFENVIQVSLIDLLDFSRKDFNKAFSMSPKKNIALTTKWEIVRFESICSIVRGASPRPIDKFITDDENGINWIKIGDVKVNDKFITQTSEKITLEGAEKSRKVNIGDFILSNSMSFGRPYILKINGCIHDGWLLISNFSQKVNKNYLYEILSYKEIQQQFIESAAGGVVQNLNTERVKGTKIPLPPMDIQIKILTDCETVDKEVEEAEKAIEKAKTEIENAIKVEGRNISLKFSEIATLEYGKPLSENERKGGEFPVLGSNGIVGFHNEFLIEGPAIIVGRKGSAGKVNFIEKSCFPIDTTFWVKSDKNKITFKYLYYLLLELNLTEFARGVGIGVPGLNRNNVHALRINIHTLEQQKIIISKIEKLEEIVKKAEITLNTAKGRKQEVLKKYL